MSNVTNFPDQLSKLGTAALQLARQGFSVFPCWPRGKNPLTEHGFKDASDDDGKIRSWWTKWPEANIGLATGNVNGIVVIDVDGSEGERLLVLLEKKFGALPPTSQSKTGNGRHLVFVLPEGCGRVPSNQRKKEGEKSSGLDIRGDGGYIVAPPSIHPDGKIYEWDEGSANEFALAPEWLPQVARNWKTEIKALDGPTVIPITPRSKNKDKPQPFPERKHDPEPYSELGKKRLQSAFTAISANDRDIWRDVGFALYDLAKSSPQWAACCREIWDKWSKTCPESFEKKQSQAYAWESFGRDYDGPRITVATIYDLAKKNGWVDQKSDAGGQTCPIIRMKGGDLAREATEGEQALIAARLPIFMRAGALVHPISEKAPASNNRTTLITKLRMLTVDMLSDWLSEHADFQRFDERKNKWVSVHPPERVTKVILARVGKFPQIAGVITTPTLRPNGSILTEPGYDPSTRLYLALDPEFTLPPIPATPTRADALKALSLLRDLLIEFPFVDNVDRAVALSGTMTAVLRSAVPVAPIHGYSANTAGTGKSHLVDIAACVATGRLCPVTAAGRTEEETEKRLGALLREGGAIISLDNVSHELSGDALAQMAERPFVRVRVLGKSEAPEFENKSALFATGNNLVLRGDMVRRALLCRLDAAMEQPETREFQSDPIARVLQNQGSYVAACLTIALAYRAAGAPKVCGPLGSYGEWSAMVRAPLVWLGESDPIESIKTVREEDPELSNIRELFDQLPGLFGEGEWTAAKLIKTACDRDVGPATSARPFGGLGDFEHPELREFLLRVAGEGGAVSGRRLGWFLRRITGRVVGGLRLCKRADAVHGHQFSLRATRQATPSPRRRED